MVRGGTILAVRQAAGLVVGLGGTIVLTRLLGPTGYGLFAAALAIQMYLFSVAQLGIVAWLVRRERTDPSDDLAVNATARTLLLGTGLVVVAAGLLVLPLVVRWIGTDGVRPLAFWLVLSIPVQLLALVPLATLERQLAYARIARTELAAQVVHYGVSIALVLAGAGPRGMVAGWWVQQLLLFVVLQALCGSAFRFAFDGAVARRAVSYGLSYATSIWTWQLRELVNPLVVGRFVGVEGVALVALAIRVVDAASFVKQATWRLALSALARLQQSPERLGAAVREGLRMQMLALAPILLVLAVAGPRIFPALFGAGWVGTEMILPLIAAGTLANAVTNLHSSALYVLGRNLQVTRFHLAHVALFAGAAWVLVPLLGLGGYGLAELAALPAYALVYASFRRTIPGARQRLELAVGACLVIAVAGCAWSAWWALVALVPGAFAPVRAATREAAHSLYAAWTARSTA